MKKELFRIHNLTLSQNHSCLLSNLHFQVFEGEHTGILFNSFKERDIFAGFLSGNLSPEKGWIYYKENTVSNNDYKKIAQKNFALITENSRLMNNLSVYENLCYSQISLFWLSAGKYKHQAQNLLSHFDLKLNVNQKVSSLTHYERIALELIKAFSQKKTIIFLSNISSLLDSSEYNRLIVLLNKLEVCGMTFIVGETFDTQLFFLTDTLYIIKSGQIIRILSGTQICKEEIQKSLGSYSVLNTEKIFYPRKTARDTVLRFENVSDTLFTDLSFTLKKGEVLKILCSNSAEAELLYNYLTQNRMPEKGEILFNELPFFKLSGKTLKKSCGIILANPRQTMVLHNMSVLDNLCLSLDRKSPGILSNLTHRKGIEFELQGQIPAEYFNKPIDSVPAEIVQKIIYCRWLLSVPDLLVCINPFSIIDPELNYISREMIRQLTKKGIAILIISNNWSLDTEIDGETFFL